MRLSGDLNPGSPTRVNAFSHDAKPSFTGVRAPHIQKNIQKETRNVTMTGHGCVRLKAPEVGSLEKQAGSQGTLTAQHTFAERPLCVGCATQSIQR